MKFGPVNRRKFLHGAVTLAGAAMIKSSLAIESTTHASPLEIGVGPQLFLDDFLVERIDGLSRQVMPPQRFGKPVLDSATFGTTQPYLTVIRDEDKKRFRVWYNNGASVWHAESDDAIHWKNPKAVWDCSHCFGASLVDDGARESDPQKRFKMANWQATRIKEDKPGDDGGMWVGFSDDGFAWKSCEKNPVLPTWPEGYDKRVKHGVGDIIDMFYDPFRKHYAASLKLHAVAEDGYAPAPRAGAIFRRLVGMSTSKDFVTWEKPWRVFTPDEKDEGLLEFYGMGGIHLRGGLYIGLVRVLRDDLSCDPGGTKDGIGYAVLATSRDGVKWQRFREPFLDRNPEPGSWDHAMTWMGYSLPMGDETFFYYGGYARGHKIAPQTERQIGLARMKRDRYVAMTGKSGTLVTRPFIIDAEKLTINADASRGEVRVRLLDVDEKIEQTLRGDVLAEQMSWPLAKWRGKAVRLEFMIRDAALYAFDLGA